MLALVAGQGSLPPHLLTKVRRPVVVAALMGFAPEIPVDLTFRVEHLGQFIHDLHQRGVTQICFAGSLARPRLDPAAIDDATRPFVDRIVRALQQGDDGALREILSIFEEQGFAIRAAHDLAPELLPTAGVLTKSAPSTQDEKDIVRAKQILDAVAVADIGQGCVVSRGQALAIETLGGTDWMLETLANNRPAAAFPGGVFAKAPKPYQDRRVDLPVIGPNTIRLAALAGLNGVVIEAGGVMVLSLAETVRLADQAGLFLLVQEAE